MMIPTECWVYMLRCRDGSLYTGWTVDLSKRMAAHDKGSGAKYTRGRGPLCLAYAQRCNGKSQALCREAEIKRLPKAKKEALCRTFKTKKDTAL